MSDWSPALYSRFEAERTRPARDLLAQVPEVSGQIIDIGCGPGNSTELLAARWPAAEIVGLDSSAAMLEEARARLPSLRFDMADANDWLPGPDVGLVFANAIYQWVPNHLNVLPRVLEAMGQGGVLAVQMPDNTAEPSHQLMREVAGTGPWAARLAGAARPALPSPRIYYDALRPQARHLDIWHTIYNHVLDGADAVVDWVRSTGLKPFLDPLAADEQAQFLAAYRARIIDAYPPAADGKVLLRFPRLFILAVR
jgi:trans-aconitate 2-methyltransferase